MDMPNTTADTLTAEQIRTIRDQALENQDESTAWVCENALNAHEDTYPDGDAMRTWRGAPTTRTEARARVAQIVAFHEANS